MQNSPLELEQKKAREHFLEMKPASISDGTWARRIADGLESIVASAFAAGERAERERRAQEMLRMTEVSPASPTGGGEGKV